MVTVSDYLARRDSEWMGPIYKFMGLTTGLIQHDMYTAERQVGYRADITYGTNNEFGFDYLRDNMAVRPEMRVQRALNYAIVDEVDSILVDEARTPLIISGRPEKSTDLYIKVDGVIRQLRREKHFELEEKGHHVMLTEEGMEAAERLMGVEDLYVDDALGIVHMIEQALRAHHFYKRDDEYMVSENGDVLIVDEFTGRAMEGRRFSDGLHQALEAKERVAIQFESQTIASITYQKYFKLYNKIAGMTGTAATEAAEFAQTYDLDVVQVPTNLPLIREDLTDLIFGTEMGKFRYVVGEIIKLHEEGRPVLVGTVSIEKSELVASELASRGIEDFQVLNAKHHEREAAIVANAGKRGAITIATNMAGRGTDIKLGEGVRELGGLAIIGTERHESRRIDNQLRGRCGRQGDPGTTRFYVSLEDEVARLFGGDRAKKLLDWVGSEEMDEEPLSQRMVSRTIERAQRQVEEYNFEIRKHLLEYDNVMDKQRQIIYGMRRDVLEDRDVSDQIRVMFENMVGDAVDEYAPDDVEPDQWDLDGLDTRFRFIFGFDPPAADESDLDPKPIEDRLVDAVVEEYARREALIADEIRAMYREQIGGRRGHGRLRQARPQAGPRLRTDGLAARGRRPLDRAPLLDGLPARIGPAARLRPEGPLGRVQGRGLRDVPADDGRYRGERRSDPLPADRSRSHALTPLAWPLACPVRRGRSVGRAVALHLRRRRQTVRSEFRVVRHQPLRACGTECRSATGGRCRCTSTKGEAEAHQGGTENQSQRPLPLRERKEIQEVLRRSKLTILSVVIVSFWLAMMGLLARREGLLEFLGGPEKTVTPRLLQPSDTWMGIYLANDDRIGFVNTTSTPESRDGEVGANITVTSKLRLSLLSVGDGDLHRRDRMDHHGGRHSRVRPEASLRGPLHARGRHHPRRRAGHGHSHRRRGTLVSVPRRQGAAARGRHGHHNPERAGIGTWGRRCWWIRSTR